MPDLLIAALLSVAANPGPPATVADLEPDGDLDIVVSVASSPNVQILRNDGTGRLSSDASYALGPALIAVRDFDGDGRVDLVAAPRAERTLRILFNDGRGAFRRDRVARLDPRFAVSAMEAIDMNRDGHVDLVLGSADTAVLGVMTNDGTGAFAPPKILAAGAGVDAMAIADLNDDGTNDLVLLDRRAQTVHVLLDGGASTFTLGEAVWNETVPRNVVLADLDADRDLDVVLTHDLLDGRSLTVLRNDGDGVFTPETSLAAGPDPVALAVGRLDGDVNLDLFVADAGAAGTGRGRRIGARAPVAVRFNAEPAAYDRAASIRIPAFTSGARLADLDQDGDADVVLTVDEPQRPRGDEPWPAPGQVVVLYNDGAGGYPRVDHVNVGNRPTELLVRDLDGRDGPDLIVPNVDDDSISILLNTGRGQFRHGRTFATGDRPGALRVIEVDGRSPADLAVVNMNGDSLTILFGRDDADFAPGTTVALGDRPGPIVFGTFDRDTLTDYACTSLADGTVHVAYGRSGGAFEPADVYAVGAGPFDLLARSINGNDDVDLIVSALDADRLTVLRNLGSRRFVEAARVDTARAPGALVARNISGGPELDLLVPHRGHGSFDVHVDWRGSGFTGRDTYTTEAGTWTVRLADVDNEAPDDLIALNRDARSVAVLRARGDGAFDNALFYDLPAGAAQFTVADFDGDGFPDLALAAERTPVVSILRNRGNGRFDAAVEFPTALVPRRIDAIDVDADGDLDLIAANAQAEPGLIAVLIGAEDATFRAPETYETPVRRQRGR